MLIFTEHDEVVMSVSDMRNLIRNAYEAGWRESELCLPATFGAEAYLAKVEKELRTTREVPK